MNKFFAVLMAGVFGLASVSVFAADTASKAAPKQKQKPLQKQRTL